MKILQILNELALPDTESFWINPQLNKTVECDDPHVPCVLQNPQIFNIDLKQFGYFGGGEWSPTAGGFIQAWAVEQDMQRSPLKMALYQRGWVRGFILDFSDSSTMGISGFQKPIMSMGPFIIKLFSRRVKAGGLNIDIEDIKKHKSFELPGDKDALYKFFRIPT